MLEFSWDPLQIIFCDSKLWSYGKYLSDHTRVRDSIVMGFSFLSI